MYPHESLRFLYDSKLRSLNEKSTDTSDEYKWKVGNAPLQIDNNGILFLTLVDLQSLQQNTF